VANGREVAEYQWSGYVFGTLLPNLQEKHQIDLMKAEYDYIADLLTKPTGATHFIFTPSQSLAFLNRLLLAGPPHGECHFAFALR
jgi:hypothetical protein